MRIFGFNITRGNPKNKILDPATYSHSDFWGDLSNAMSTDKGMKLAAVFRCIDVLSDNISMLPWASVDTKTHEKPDDRYVQQIWYLLNIRPNRNMTPAVFFKTLEQHRLNGNAYVEIVTAGNGVPTELLLIEPDLVEPEKLDNGDVVYKVTDEKGSKHTLLSGEILHFKNISRDGLVGESVLSFASDSIANMTYQEQFNKNFYQKGGRPSGVLTASTDLSSVEIKRKQNGLDIEKSFRDVLREDFEKHVGGSANAGRVAILDNGLTYQAIQPISQKDMAFVESKEVSIADIARFYGVPLYKLFTGKESYQSNEQNNIAFVTDKLNPIITGYEQELTYKLISDERLRAKVQIKANLNVLLRGDIAARTTHYKEMWGIGAYNINKILNLENQPSIGELGEKHFASKNYAFLEEFAKTADEMNNIDPDPDEGVEHNPESEEDCRARARRLGFPQSQCVQADTGDKGWYIAPNGITKHAAKKAYANARADGKDKETAAKIAWTVQKQGE